MEPALILIPAIKQKVDEKLKQKGIENAVIHKSYLGFDHNEKKLFTVVVETDQGKFEFNKL